MKNETFTRILRTTHSVGFQRATRAVSARLNAVSGVEGFEKA